MLKIFKTVQNLFIKPAAKPMPKITLVRSAAARTVSAPEMVRKAFSIGPVAKNPLREAYLDGFDAFNHLRTVLPSKVADRLVFVENVGVGISNANNVLTGFAGTQLSANIGCTNAVTGMQHQFAWVLPKRQVRFATPIATENPVFLFPVGRALGRYGNR